MKLDEKFISYSCVAIRRPVYIFVVIESTADVVVLGGDSGGMQGIHPPIIWVRGMDGLLSPKFLAPV
jgi:hypothetical protein